MSDWIAHACSEGARLEHACAALGLTPSTLQRWRQAGAVRLDRRQREWLRWV